VGFVAIRYEGTVCKRRSIRTKTARADGGANEASFASSISRRAPPPLAQCLNQENAQLLVLVAMVLPGDQGVSEDIRAANADAEAALRSDRELQHQCASLRSGALRALSAIPVSQAGGPPSGGRSNGEFCFCAASREPQLTAVLQSVVARFVASSLAKLFLLAAVLAGSASLAVRLLRSMTMAQALGVVCAVDFGAMLLLVLFIRSGGVGEKASGASSILHRAGGRVTMLQPTDGQVDDGGAAAGGGLSAMLEAALVKVLLNNHTQPAAAALPLPARRQDLESQRAFASNQP
jgi:hypothetical protein